MGDEVYIVYDGKGWCMIFDGKYCYSHLLISCYFSCWCIVGNLSLRLQRIGGCHWTEGGGRVGVLGFPRVRRWAPGFLFQISPSCVTGKCVRGLGSQNVNAQGSELVVLIQKLLARRVTPFCWCRNLGMLRSWLKASWWRRKRRFIPHQCPQTTSLNLKVSCQGKHTERSCAKATPISSYSGWLCYAVYTWTRQYQQLSKD